MAARQEVTFIITARDRTRAIFRRIGAGIRRLRLSAGGLLGGGLFGAAAKGALDFATAIEGASSRLDITSDTLQALKIQAEDLNIPFTSLVTVIQRINRNAGQALAGDSQMVENFRRLGITFEELRRLNPEDLFFAVADAAADTSRSWRETSALIAKVGDTEAVALRGLLVQGGDALARGANALQDANKLQTPEALRKAAEAEQETRRALLEANKAFTEAVVGLTPILQTFTEVVTPLVRAYAETIAAGQGSGGFGAGQRAAEIFGPERRATAAELATLDPEIRALLARTANASEETARKINDSGVLR